MKKFEFTFCFNDIFAAIYIIDATVWGSLFTEKLLQKRGHISFLTIKSLTSSNVYSV